MELLRGKSLQSLIETQKSFSDIEASQIMRGILKGVNYVHQQGFVHRDLKPGKNEFTLFQDNILFAEPGNLDSIKIADFGLGAKYGLKNDSGLDAHCGTLIFMAPEVIKSKEYTKKVDVFSIGIIMYLLLTGGKHPIFEETDSVKSFKNKIL